MDPTPPPPPPCTWCGGGGRRGGCPACGKAREATPQDALVQGRVARLTVFGWTRLGRGLSVVSVALLPAVAFLFATADHRGFIVPSRRDAFPDVFPELMLHAGVAAPFVPLLVLGPLAAARFACNPRRAIHERWVNVGLWVGVALAAQFSYFLLATWSEGLQVATAVVAVGAVLVVQAHWASVTPDWQPATARGFYEANGFLVGLAAVSFAAALLLAANLGSPTPALSFYPLLALAAVCLAPLLQLLLFTQLLVRRSRSLRLVGDAAEAGRPRRDPWVLVLAASAVNWVLAWPLSVELAVRHHASLPAEPPEACFVASAAARGHPRVVGSRRVRLPGGAVVPVTRQLRTLKAGEVALAATCPPLHRAARRVYDALGPRLARRIANPHAATAAWLLLQPAALLTRVTLLAPVRTREIQRLYGAARPPAAG